MSTSKKRFLDDDLLRQRLINSTSCIQKRLCSSLVPSVPSGGTNSIQISSLEHSMSSTFNSNLNTPFYYSDKLTTLDAGDRAMNKIERKNEILIFSSFIFISRMNNNKKNNLTINIYADDQCRSSNNNNNDIKIDLNAIQILYPPLFDVDNLPSVPLCHQQNISSKNIDRKIQANLE